MLYFNGYEFNKELPQGCIDDCSGQGQADEAVAYWSKELSLCGDVAKTKEFLRGYGAWEEVELQDHEANLQRVLWLIAGDEAERAAE